MRLPHPFYLAAATADWLALGFFTVTMSWLAVTSSGAVGAVGVFWFATSLSSLLFMPVFGALLDRAGTRFPVLVGAQAVRFLALAGLYAADRLGHPGQVSLIELLIVAVLFGPANGMANVALDSIVLGAMGGEDRPVIVRRVALARQVALGAGFAFAGYLVAEWDAKSTAAVGALFCLASAALAAAMRLPLATGSAVVPSSFRERLTRGGKVVMGDPRLLTPALLVVAAFAVSQVSNALLAPILAAQGKSAMDFGLVESVWTWGAIGAALVLAVREGASPGTSRAIALLVALGALCVLFAFTDSTAGQLVLFAFMGALFSTVRIEATAAIAEAADADCLGPVQASVSAAVSAVALGVYLVPTLLPGTAPALTYAISGTVVMAVGGIALVRTRATSTAPRSVRETGP